MGQNGFKLDGRTDESFTISGSLGRALSRTATVSFDAYATWFDSGLPGIDDAFSAGIAGNYYQTLWVDRLQGYVALGLFTSDAGAFDDTIASALIGLRYTF